MLKKRTILVTFEGNYYPPVALESTSHLAEFIAECLLDESCLDDMIEEEPIKMSICVRWMPEHEFEQLEEWCP